MSSDLHELQLALIRGDVGSGILRAVLSDEELRRRLVAARELRGLTQKDLDRLGAQDGLGKLEAGRVERGTIEFRRKHIDVFARHLRVSDAWFEEPDVDRLLGFSDAARVEDRLERIERALSAPVNYDRLVERLRDEITEFREAAGLAATGAEAPTPSDATSSPDATRAAGRPRRAGNQ